MARCALGFLLAISLCGCSLQPSVPTADGLGYASRSVASNSTIPALAASSGVGEPSVKLFNAMNKKVAQLAAPGIGFLAFDTNGDIYLSPLNMAELLVYAPPYTQQPTTIALPGNAGRVAVDWKSGVFALIAAPSSPNGTSKVVFFRHGTTVPCKKVQWAAGNLASVGTFDADGTFFTIIANGDGTNTVASVAGECAARTVQTYSPNIGEVGTIGFNSEDQLAIDTYYRDGKPGPVVTYPHPKSGVLAAPISKTYLGAINGLAPVLETLGSDGKSLWAGNYTGSFAEYDYPSGGKPIKIINVYQGYSIDVYPQVLP